MLHHQISVLRDSHLPSLPPFLPPSLPAFPFFLPSLAPSLPCTNVCILVLIVQLLNYIFLLNLCLLYKEANNKKTTPNPTPRALFSILQATFLSLILFRCLSVLNKSWFLWFELQINDVTTPTVPKGIELHVAPSLEKVPFFYFSWDLLVFCSRC